MKRYKILENFLECVENDSILIFSGKDLCSEAIKYDDNRCFYIINIPGMALSIATGVAATSDKKVYVFIDDYSLLEEMGSMAQMSVSKCKNLFCILFVSGYYQQSGGQPTIIEGISSVKQLLFGLGVVVYDVEHYFKTKKTKGNLRRIISSVKGPTAFLFYVSKGLSNNVSEVKLSGVELRNRFNKFINK